MTFPTPEAKRDYVRRMFTRIARRYDLMNRVMTGGRDRRWRELTAQAAQLPPDGRALDVGAGTGDLALALLKAQPSATVVASDFTPAMLQLARRKLPPQAPPVASDALWLPFAEASFDAVVSGFVLRNLADLQAGLREMARVTRPGGRVVSLEIAQPTGLLVRTLHRLYFHGAVPLIGALLAGSYTAYRYLPSSLDVFLTPAELERELEAAGLIQVGHHRIAFGGVVIHWGVKPAAGAHP